MKSYVESIKRLVSDGKLNTEKVDTLHILTEEEKAYVKADILAPENEYKEAYETLTDGATIEPLEMRGSIQALFASADDTSIVNAEPFVDEWKAGTMEQPIEYKIGDVRKENGQVYECKQAHTHHGEVGWNPSILKAGWIVKHTKDTSNPKSYIQPQGAHDAYMKDECVSWEGKVYVSLADSNVYSPTDYPQNWKEVELPIY